ncbi:hypothetical protein H8F21_14245 [Pseudomonas sp. P66]|uniref:TIGR04086 family membrane protein n=1 Tax=Pseudomonas arcuscaelestis TaxID=2710591 RepID=A0ABS2BZ12_9PSED|nr:hypothetical protein [Pseudomonas arcuscaelestis]MBM5458725.1 hypothetical protein [Pseudomonas arcuscaelestis]
MKAAHIYLLLASAFGLMLAMIFPGNPVFLQITLCVAISAFVSSVGAVYLNKGATVPGAEVKSFCLAFFVAVLFSLLSCAVVLVFGGAREDVQWVAMTIQGAMGGVVGAIVGHLWHERQERIHGTHSRTVDVARDRARG